MTPAEHIAEAERILTDSNGNPWSVFEDRHLPALLAAASHALIAVAVELGAPHPAAPAGGEPGAQAPAAG